MRRATIYTLDQSMFAGGIGIELARTWENEIDNWGTCESPLKFGGVGRPCHDLPYLPRTPREPIMPSRVKSRQLACHLPDGLQASQRQPVHVQDVLEAVVAMWDVNAVHPQDVLEVVVATLDAAGARSRVWC